MICIFIFQQTQKQDGGYLNPQNKWNVGSDAFIIAQNINHKRERGVLLKATLFILTKLKMIDPYRHWRTSTDFIVNENSQYQGINFDKKYYSHILYKTVAYQKCQSPHMKKVAFEWLMIVYFSKQENGHLPIQPPYTIIRSTIIELIKE